MMAKMVRGVISEVKEGQIKRFSATGRENETFQNREFIQQYGFTSRPPVGAEAVLINEGNHILMIGTDDRRYRVAVEGGEVAIYSQYGQRIVMKANGEIHINGPIVLTGNLTMTGNLAVTGDVTATGTIIDTSGNTSHHSH